VGQAFQPAVALPELRSRQAGKPAPQRQFKDGGHRPPYGRGERGGIGNVGRAVPAEMLCTHSGTKTAAIGRPTGEETAAGLVM